MQRLETVMYQCSNCFIKLPLTCRIGNFPTFAGCTNTLANGDQCLGSLTHGFYLDNKIKYRFKKKEAHMDEDIREFMNSFVVTVESASKIIKHESFNLEMIDAVEIAFLNTIIGMRRLKDIQETRLLERNKDV